MVDISELKRDSALGICDRYFEAIENKKRKRNYLGMSSIGDECARRLWLNLHTPRHHISARMLRLFDLGKMIEKRIIKQLRKAGLKVEQTQLKFSDHGGKFKGHCDGVISGLPESSKPHILEIKTASNKYFEDMKKSGVTHNEIYGPKYMAQIQCYMGYAGFDRGLWVVENKDNSEQYQERVRFDRAIFERLKAKALWIVSAKYPLEGISLDTTSWKCRFCDYKASGECLKRWPGEPAF